MQVYRNSNPGLGVRVYFMMYKMSCEEGKYLTGLRREKESFERLIKERGVRRHRAWSGCAPRRVVASCCAVCAEADSCLENKHVLREGNVLCTGQWFWCGAHSEGLGHAQDTGGYWQTRRGSVSLSLLFRARWHALLALWLSAF